jgi:hypothetical protein
MSKRLLIGAMAGLAASLSLATAVRADVVTFDDRTFDPGTYQTEANQFDEQGLHFEGMQFYFIPAGNPVVNFPTGYASTFMETAQEPVIVSLTGGGAFNFLSLRLGLGDFNMGDADTVAVTGTKANCSQDCTVSTTLTVTNVFQTYALTGFTGLSQISFGQQQLVAQLFPPGPDSGYVAFDNLGFSTGAGGAVPEPASWSLLIAGFAGVGAMIRRGRRSPVQAPIA